MTQKIKHVLFKCSLFLCVDKALSYGGTMNWFTWLDLDGKICPATITLAEWLIEAGNNVRKRNKNKLLFSQVFLLLPFFTQWKLYWFAACLLYGTLRRGLASSQPVAYHYSHPTFFLLLGLAFVWCRGGTTVTGRWQVCGAGGRKLPAEERLKGIWTDYAKNHLSSTFVAN